MSNPSTSPKPADVPAPSSSSSVDPQAIRAEVEKLVAEGKKAVALHQWEQGVDRYATALDRMRLLVGDADPEMAPLLLAYGKALYDLASSQAGVMGREEPVRQEDDVPAETNNLNFVFSGDAPSDDEGEADDPEPEPESEPQASSSSAPAAAPAGTDAAEGDEVGELEDDYNAAWEVLDVARTIYEKIVDGLKEGEGNKERMLLSDCYLALGNVSCETENFPQAVQDFTAAVDIQNTIIPPSFRDLASAHYQLATALEFTPSPQSRTSALTHVESALSSLVRRKEELLSSDESTLSEAIKKMTPKEKEAEMKDVEALMGDLQAKIEELKAAPPAEDLIHESISHLMGQAPEASGSGSRKEESGPVNDLTGMVKKKKPKATPVAPAPVVEKRAAEGGEEPAAKKAKNEEA
ncbi:HAT1-interacting factor 1 [Cryptococcus neoformans var. grubii H99]|uniref:HAT1-interacting factor 1 n=1 Tax=Cryptococcus neoformans (strain H99 / ATCC 208821 / CBS 10515 / FGSC 9487) TaxID=235443 RepID=J9VLV7_CRYN9|nr:HAT1-interacting factor 1 [Cryptococcus neoformans var. grubii H99]AFR93579.2 HAT1-interacting factor 1 [Cryptococcus neoformans var. grubii H99]AUB23136.1 HAT1-interacting factor 1 [Cryptococcus neoformans var. grubii]|eukprot:XP_012047322.1 HAT1-interacting factor 1 [Cryptococcus neoformans var. grubii H99]